MNDDKNLDENASKSFKNDNHLRWSDVAKKWKKNNKLKVLSILGGSKQGGAESFLRDYPLLWRKKYQFTNNNKKNEERFSFLSKKIN